MTATQEQREAASQRAQRPRRSKGEGSVFQTTVKGEKVWRATHSLITDEGKRKIITGTSPSKTEAIARRDRLHRKYLVTQGLADPAILIDKDTKLYTLEEWLEKWVEELDPNVVQANTRQRTKGLIKNHINPHLGKKKLRSITEAHINELLKETLPNKKYAVSREVEKGVFAGKEVFVGEKGVFVGKEVFVEKGSFKGKEAGEKLLGSSPIRGIYYILKDAFKDAERQGIITTTPMKYIDAPKKTRKTPLNLTERGDDVGKIFDYLIFKDEEKAHWILSFYGLRASERLGLEWSSISNLTQNLKKPAILTIDRQLYNDAEARKLYIKRQTKTEAGTRQIPLPDDVRVILIDHKARQLEQKKSPRWKPKDEFKDLIYTTATGNAIRQSTDNDRWRAFIKNVGLKPLKGHDMRHLTASWLARTGVSAEVAKTILGHTSEAMTSYYTHISLQSKNEAITQLSMGYDKALDTHLLASHPSGQEKDTEPEIDYVLKHAAAELKAKLEEK